MLDVVFVETRVDPGVEMTICQSKSSKVSTATLSGDSSNEFERQVIDSRWHGEDHTDYRERYG